MKIKEIINKIEKLEQDFEIFNSRIIEFGKSTRNSDLDRELIKKYISNLKDYKKLILEYNLEIEENISEKDNEEFIAQKPLVLSRLEKLDRIFSNSIKKLEIIEKSFKDEKGDKNNNNEVFDFESSIEMKEINNELYSFYNNYNRNLEFQVDYKINIKLDDKFESKQEEELNSIDLIKQEKQYLFEMNEIFEGVEFLKIDLFNKIEELLKLKNLFFDDLDKIKDYYFVGVGENFFSEILKNNLKQDYTNKYFNISKSEFVKDFKKVKKAINLEISYIDFLINFNYFYENFEDFKILNEKYKIFFNEKFFEELNNILNNLVNKKFSSVLDIINYLNKNLDIKNILNNKLNKKLFKIILKKLEIFRNSFKYIKKYKFLYNKKSKQLDYGILNNLINFINSRDGFGEKYIKSGLENLKKDFAERIDNLSIESFSSLNSLNSFIKKEYLKLEKIEKQIGKIGTNISKINYTSTSSKITKFKTKNKSILLKINLLFGLSDNFNEYKNINLYLNKIIKNRFDSAKRAYINSQRTYSSGTTSSYSGSSSSYSSSSSSSSRSSGSSSYSSSYSSSGSSSW